MFKTHFQFITLKNENSHLNFRKEYRLFRNVGEKNRVLSLIFIQIYFQNYYYRSRSQGVIRRNAYMYILIEKTMLYGGPSNVLHEMY